MASILVADDDVSVRFTIRDFLESVGHSVTEACSGKECMTILDQGGDFDAVIIDVIMPEKDGVETMREIKRSRPDLKVVVTSGGGRSRNLELLDVAKVLGADAVLSKPFTQSQLLEILADCLDG